jgi:hypothetical protein
MKKLISILGLGLILLNLSGQKSNVPTPDEIANFVKTKTLVVLEDNPLSEYNLVLKSVMGQEWTMTPFDFIKYSDFEKRRLDSKYSFIVLTQVKYDKDKTNSKYNFVSLVLGGTAYSLTSMPDLCSIPLSYSDVGDEDYSYKLGIFLRFMQNHVKMLMENPGLASENILNHYNKNMKELKGKTLYLVASEMAKDVNTAAKIKKVYPGPFKLVSKDDIQKAIADKEDIVFLHKVGPQNTRQKARVFKILIGASDAQFYYFDYHMLNDKNPDGFLESDFKRLAKKL